MRVREDHEVSVRYSVLVRSGDGRLSRQADQVSIWTIGFPTVANGNRVGISAVAIMDHVTRHTLARNHG